MVKPIDMRGGGGCLLLQHRFLAAFSIFPPLQWRDGNSYLRREKLKWQKDVSGLFGPPTQSFNFSPGSQALKDILLPNVDIGNVLFIFSAIYDDMTFLQI